MNYQNLQINNKGYIDNKKTINQYKNTIIKLT